MRFLRQICGLLVFVLMMGLAQSVFAGHVARNPVSVDAGLSPREQAEQRALIEQNRAELIGAVAGYVLSGGNPDNVNAAATTAKSGLANNRQLHRDEAERIAENAQAFVDWACAQHQVCGLTTDQATGLLVAATLANTDSMFADGTPSATAEAATEFLTLIGQGERIAGTDQRYFEATAEEFRNHQLNGNRPIWTACRAG